VLNHAFLLALALVVFILACAWIYRVAVLSGINRNKSPGTQNDRERAK
jgi:hypothetical protein